jgi:hypothetical protein
MALQNSDLFYVARGGDGYKMPASELIDFIAATPELVYRGQVDCTLPVGSQLDPNPPVVGDIYINTGTGNVDTSGTDSTDAWVGINAPNTPIADGQRIVFDGTTWAIIGSTGEGTVVTVEGVDPIEVTGTPADRLVSIKDATTTQKGAVQLNSTVTYGGTDETTAVTPKGVSDYAVPLNLTVLDPLP